MQFDDHMFSDDEIGNRGFITSWPIRARDIYNQPVGGLIGVHEHQERIEVAMRVEERVARLVATPSHDDAADAYRKLGEAIALRKLLRGEL